MRLFPWKLSVKKIPRPYPGEEVIKSLEDLLTGYIVGNDERIEDLSKKYEALRMKVWRDGKANGELEPERAPATRPLQAGDIIGR